MCCLSLLGCSNKSAVNQQVRDPLLISKKPIEGKAERAAVPEVAYAEPSPPPAPESALATAPVRLEPIAKASVERPLVPAKAKPPVLATPASRTSESAEPPVATASRRDPASIYRHAADHSWLQGVLDKHYHGYLTLRYCDHTEDDEWGGKVILQEDSRLTSFKDGDVVRVEGEVVREDGKVKLGMWNHFPVYRIKDIRLIQSK
jgi:hypothetical protein